MSSVSGLSPKHREQARGIIVRGAELMLAHKSLVHYTQGARRWDGINQHLLITRGQYPRFSDCSSSASWLHWNALYVPFGVRDVVNGDHWSGHYSFTGTMAQHGKRVLHDENIRIGDLVLYGAAPTFEHVAVALGGGYVFSHGSEGGPYKLEIDYRNDRGMVRRYI